MNSTLKLTRQSRLRRPGSPVVNEAVWVVAGCWVACLATALAADWKTEANARIESLRKRSIRLEVRGPDGLAVPGVAISAHQRRSHFAFGCALSGIALPNRQYRQFFADHFEWAVFENEVKWPANEPTRGAVTFGIADAQADFCRQNGIRMRGHTLFWEDTQYVQNWVQALTPDDLRIAISNRIQSAVTHFRGTFEHWDVDNELLHGHNFYRGRLGAAIVPSMFQQAKAIAPETRWFVNDYNVIEGGDTAAYVRTIQSLLDQGTPIGGIGAQGHFFAPINPDDLAARLKQLGTFGLPVWITEFDYANSDPSARAESLETALRMAFSQPEVEGFLFWGYWAGAHWRGADAALVDADFTVNAAGQRYLALRSEWTTTADGVADTNGVWGFRGFQGEYEVTVRVPGRDPVTQWLWVDPGSDEERAVIPVVPTPRPRFESVQPLGATVSLRWEPLAGAVACKLQSSADLASWTDLSPVMSQLARAWVDRRPPVDPARFYRVLPTTNLPVVLDRDFNLSEGGTSSLNIDATGIGTTVPAGPIHQVYYWFASPDLRNGVLQLEEDGTLASPAGGPPGVLHFRMLTRPTLKAGGSDYWGFVLPGFGLMGFPLGTATATDLTHAQLQFRYRLTQGRLINVRLEPTAIGGGFDTRCDFGNLTGSGAWRTFSAKLSAGANVTAFRNFLNTHKSAALQLVFGNGAGVSSYANGDDFQIDDIIVSYTP
jgi:GH35 family endo-1,4-beta-xylanase